MSDMWVDTGQNNLKIEAKLKKILEDYFNLNNEKNKKNLSQLVKKAKSKKDRTIQFIKNRSKQRKDTKISTTKQAEEDILTGTNITDIDNDFATIEKMINSIEDMQQQLSLSAEEVSKLLESWEADSHIPQANVVTTEKSKGNTSSGSNRVEHVKYDNKRCKYDKSEMEETLDILKSLRELLSSQLCKCQCDEKKTILGDSLQKNSVASCDNRQLPVKAKKKKMQDRNTKIVNLETLDGYRGNDPIHLLVEYIEKPEINGVKVKGNSKKKYGNKKENTDNEKAKSNKGNKNKKANVKEQESKEKQIMETKNVQFDLKKNEEVLNFKKNCTRKNDIKKEENKVPKVNDRLEKEKQLKLDKEKELNDEIKNKKELKCKKQNGNGNEKEEKEKQSHKNKSSKMSTSFKKLSNCSVKDTNVLKKSEVKTDVPLCDKNVKKTKSYSLSIVNINKNIGDSKANISYSQENKGGPLGIKTSKSLEKSRKINENISKAKDNENKAEEIESELPKFQLVTKKKKGKKQRAKNGAANINCGRYKS